MGFNLFNYNPLLCVFFFVITFVYLTRQLPWVDCVPFVIRTFIGFCIFTLKEHVALHRASWSLKSVWNPFVLICMYKIDNLEVEYNDPHKHACKLYGFPYTLWTNTKWAILWSDSTKMADHVCSRRRRKPCNFEGCLCGSFYSTFKLSI